MFLSDPTGAELGSPSKAYLYIVNDDTGLEFSSDTYKVDELTGVALITVIRTGVADSEVKVDYYTEADTATPNEDYVDVEGTLVFEKGEMFKTFLVPIMTDSAIEGPETVTLNLKDPVNAALLDKKIATLIINDNPPTVEFGLGLYSVNKANMYAEITAIRTGVADSVVTVNYLSVAGTASPGVDYENVNGTLTFNEGERTKVFQVPILQNNLDDPVETVKLILYNPSGVVLGNQKIAMLNITPPPIIQFSSAKYKAGEGGPAIITVTRTGDYSSEVMVNYITSAGSATPDVDYTNVSGTLEFESGETVKTFSVPIMHDNVVEADETVQLKLTNPVGAILGSISQATLTIVDDDVYIKFSPNSYMASRHGTNVTISVILTGVSSSTVAVHYHTEDGTAKSGTDYTATSGILIFNPNETSKTFKVPIYRTATPSSFSIYLSDATNGTIIGGYTATVTITS